MDNKTNSLEVPQKGNILIINTGSTTTKLGSFQMVSGSLTPSLSTPPRMSPNTRPVMDQADMRHQAIKDFMASKGIR